MKKLFRCMSIFFAASLLLCSCVKVNQLTEGGSNDNSSNEGDYHSVGSEINSYSDDYAEESGMNTISRTSLGENNGSKKASESNSKVEAVKIAKFNMPEFLIPKADYDLSSVKNTNVVFPLKNNGFQNSMSDFIGANHIWVGYTHLGMDGLSEGGARTTELGSNTIKVYLTNYYKDNYPAGTEWGTGKITSAVSLVQHKYFKELFDQDLETIVIGTYIFNNTFGHPATYFIKTFTEESRQIEYREMYQLVYYLCKTYEGTGKTFIIQNWESDWACMPSSDAEYNPPQDVFDRLIKWINIRQDAVMDARRDADSEGVQVYNALEVNLIDKAIKGKPCVTNNVIPYTYCDFYSYSAYDTQSDENLFGQALDYLSKKVASNRTGGKSRCYIGEFGWPKSLGEKQAEKIASIVLRVAKKKGYSHAYWWQMYDGYDVSGKYDPNKPPKDTDYAGYWLITAEGRYTSIWNFFYKAIHGYDDLNYIRSIEDNTPEFPLYIKISERNDFDSNGIQFKNLDYDGKTEVVDYQSKYCFTTVMETGQGNIYFDVNDNALTKNDNNITVEITYFDEGSELLSLAYNSENGEVAKVVSFKRTNTMQWKIHSFVLSDAGLDNLFHQGFADIRFYNNGNKMYISNVKIIKN